MTALAQHPADAPPPASPVDPSSNPVRWAREVGLIVGFYLLYSLVRNRFGSASVAAADAYANAVRVIDLERAFGIFNEADVQSWFLGAPGFLRAVNIYYGTLHFIVPIGVLAFLALRHPAAYRFWRTTILATTAVALVGFALMPLMPPRLLCECPYGAGTVAAADGQPVFVDTLAEFGGLWSFDSSTVQAVSNQYAAMPSLHVGWALWCALAMLPFLRRWWAKALAVAYPGATTLAVVITGNHFWLDAVGGVAVVAVGYGIAVVIRRAIANRRKDAGTVTGETSPESGLPVPPGAALAAGPGRAVPRKPDRA
jgi:hypothetical protein